MPAVPAPSPWILGPWKDLLLFIGTPLLIVPAVLTFQLGYASRDIQYFVLAFGSMGHNLPGMLRAYGDRELFRRFRARFLLAPLAFTILAIALSYRGGNGLTLILFLWSVWHALMQHYGFLRIYDAKVGNFAPLDARLDFYLCVVGFASVVLFADHRLDYIQSSLAAFGIPPLPLEALGVLRGIALAVFSGLCCAYAWNQLRRWRAKLPVNGAKSLSMLTALCFWWYANVWFEDILVGVVLFEIFHDVQYLAIVWIFHRRRVDAGAPVGGFTRFLFRRSYGLMALYVGLCFAYGSFLPVSRSLASSDDRLLMLAGAFVTISGLMHFYFDGFIWKVREGSTRRGLGLDETAGRSDLRVTRHGLKWLFLLVPAAAFWIHGDQPIDLPMARALAASAPEAGVAQARLGDRLVREQQFAAAVEAYERALAASDAPEEVPRNWGIARMDAAMARVEGARAALRTEDLESARRLLEAARTAIPNFVIELHDRGHQRWMERRYEDAILDYRAALLLEPDLGIAHLNLALAYRDAGHRALALQHAKRGAELVPGNEKAQRLVLELQR